MRRLQRGLRAGEGLPGGGPAGAGGAAWPGVGQLRCYQKARHGSCSDCGFFPPLSFSGAQADLPSVTTAALRGQSPAAPPPENDLRVTAKEPGGSLSPWPHVCAQPPGLPSDPI